MKWVTKVGIMSLCVAVSVMGTGLVYAQQDNTNNNRGGRSQGRRNFDPARMQEFMLDRATTDLGLKADEAKVIVPKIQNIIKLRVSTMEEMRPLVDDLRSLLDSQKPSNRAIKQQLDKIKAKANDIKKRMDTAETDLKSVLTVKQEAELMLRGIVTNGVGIGGMGFGRGPGRGGFRGRNRSGQNNSNN